MGRASGNNPRDRDRDSRDRDRRRERSRSRDRSRDRGRHDKDHRRDRSPGRDRPRHYDRDRHRDRSRSRGRREGGGVSGDHGRRSQPRDGRGGREGDALPTSFSGRDDREGKGLRDDDTSTSLESRGRAKFTEAGAEPLDEFAPAELLNRLEKLEVKRDFDRLKRFVDEVASLLHNDQDNRELVQLHQQATALLQQLESATPAAAEVPSPTPSGSAPDAVQAPAGSAATKAEDESDEEWKKPPVRWLATVVSFNVKKGFGFLRPDDESVVPAGQDIFVHKAAVQVQGPGQTVLAEGQRVSFVLKEEPGNGRLCALDVRDPDGNAIVQEVNQSTLDLRSHTETWRGLKDQQEDRWTGPEDMGDMGQYFGIFDGHGGIFTSEYLARNMHKAILSRKKGLSNFQNNEASVRRLVQDTFSLTDKELMKLPAYAKARDGSTALVVMISGSDQPVAGKPGNIRVMVANVGDSRAVMCRSGRGIRLSEDHKPNRGDEERRVKSAGGHVVCIGGIHRVTTAAGAGAGVNLKEHQYLAVSRSFGDSELKSPNALVTCAPEIKAFDVTAQDSFIVMACDGIWDVLDDQAVCEIAGEHFGRPKDAAASVVRAAYQRGSGDNLTATVIEFGWVTPEQFKAHLEQYVEEQEQGKDEDLDMFGD